jgi:phosphoenolpyruvate carboxylase
MHPRVRLLTHKHAQPLPPQVASAFNQLLNLHNVTEEIVTARVETAQRLGEVESTTRSTNKSFEHLVKNCGVTPEQIYEALCNQMVDLVFTAHPTQVRCWCCRCHAHVHGALAEPRWAVHLLHNYRWPTLTTSTTHPSPNPPPASTGHAPVHAEKVQQDPA